ncbi:tRNA (adenosine(37)-N6)-threonylcarbamoyltransferase complex dimerization subunit type 1 TsaB [Caenispirillum bisanense]|uniref:tRNA threonylcarbamoyladenosine biosynthesis protein TsaB n=1 Tax=Caenispirillum bisanense TaxID=414052 RepID=A0A286GUD1_9PROT|nr:tRNA (adenosine(37)-N6)-threonylcarbamoyltransferase complex dimerization subunit type 1 TsaB [Caenispirillum bisanense]SOD99173.1 tRNA threonylcarbamoyladenosine biosynthesis protein TsaB [Caenispirillum bisanense]
MLILALDTAMAACAVCVWRDGTVLAARRDAMSRGQAEALVPMVQAVMAEAGVAWGDLDRIAVTVGPGSFTGLRVGLSTARALGLAAGKPVVGVTTTEVLAAAVPPEVRAGRRVLAAVDSKRADLFLQWFDADLAPLGPPQSAEPEAVRADLAAAPAVVTGDAADLLAPLPAGAEAVAAGAQTPEPAVLAALAADRPLPAAPPQPLYIRPPDAALPAGGGQLRPSSP